MIYTTFNYQNLNYTRTRKCILMLEINSSIKEFIQSECIVKLNRSFYGLQESGKLWNQLVRNLFLEVCY